MAAAKKDRHRSSIERSYMMDDTDSGPGGGGCNPHGVPSSHRPFDTVSQASSSDVSGSSGVGSAGNTDGIVHMNGSSIRYQSSSSGGGGGGGFSKASSATVLPENSSSGGESATSGSMLVAEHGFVRFRAIDQQGGAAAPGSGGPQIPMHPSFRAPTMGR